MIARVLLLLYLLSAGAVHAQTPPAASPAEKLIAAINAVRLVERKPLLRTNPKLNAAAKTHAADMAAREFFGHKNPEGEGLTERLARVHYKFALALENIAVGQRDPQIVVADWLESDGHKQNLLDPNVRDIGAAYLYYASDPAVARRRHYWVVVLAVAAPKSPQEPVNAER